MWITKSKGYKSMFFTTLLEGEAGGAGSSLISFGLIAVLLLFFYFFMIRPQKKKEKEDQQMRDALCVGDEVITIGGIIGKVVSIKDETFVLETTKAKTRIRFLKGAIRSVDVRITDTLAPKADDEKKDTDAKAIEPQAPVADEKPAKKKAKKADAEAAVEAPAAEPRATEEKSEG